MRKIILFVLLTTCINSLAHQKGDSILVNKNGVRILPRKGNFTIGLSANPVFNFVGNTFNNSANNLLNLELLNGNMLYGKYFITRNMAIRARVNVEYSSETYSNSIPENIANSSTVKDQLLTKKSDITIAGGIEKRIGNTRLQFAYGGEIVFARGRQVNTYTYGNDMNSSNLSPLSTLSFEDGTYSSVTSRILESDTGPKSLFGARSFLSIEYYVAPKMALCAEIGYGIFYLVQGKKKTKREFTEPNGYNKETNSIDGSQNLKMENDILDGQIIFLFHL